MPHITLRVIPQLLTSFHSFISQKHWDVWQRCEHESKLIRRIDRFYASNRQVQLCNSSKTNYQTNRPTNSSKHHFQCNVKLADILTAIYCNYKTTLPGSTFLPLLPHNRRNITTQTSHTRNGS